MLFGLCVCLYACGLSMFLVDFIIMEMTWLANFRMSQVDGFCKLGCFFARMIFIISFKL